jgi:glycolate oxidase iron-sulfur subunit
MDIPERHFCCGSAGTYNLLQPEIAVALGRRKAAHIDSVDPDIVAAGNLGCIVQIARFARAPVVHTVELLDWATGGPIPQGLRGQSLREPTPQSSPNQAAGALLPADQNPTAIW